MRARPAPTKTKGETSLGHLTPTTLPTHYPHITSTVTVLTVVQYYFLIPDWGKGKGEGEEWRRDETRQDETRADEHVYGSKISVRCVWCVWCVWSSTAVVQ